LQFGPVFLLLAGWLWLVEARPLWTIGFERRRWLQQYLRGACFGLVFMAGAVVLMVLPGYVTIDASDPSHTGWPALGGVLVLGLGWLVQGAAEESVARGFLLPMTGVRWGAFAGVVVSSLVFAALHGANPNLSPVAATNLLLVSVFLALYALYEGGLWGVCAFHSVWNWAQGNLFGFEVSGTSERWSMLLDLRETGPDLITGGPFGPEGGLAVTTMLAIGILGVAVAAHRRRSAPH
jgi:membrane protease YdiL (CAAX protease family)